MHNQRVGKQGEKMVETYLRQKGYQILENNFLRRVGEVDLIVTDPHTQEIVFVEVKTRNNHRFGYPEEAVTVKKIQKIGKTAQSWLETQGKLDNLWRIDIISVELGRSTKLTHLKNVTL